MHRIATIAGDGSEADLTLIEQPAAPVLFITSAVTDIATLSSVLILPEQKEWQGVIRALPLAAIQHPAQIDHYISITAERAEMIIVRLLGGRGHWSYGIEKLDLWQKASKVRKLLIVSGKSYFFL